MSQQSSPDPMGAGVIQPDMPPAALTAIPGAVGGLVGAIIGAGIWAVVGILTDNEIGWIAIGVGFLAGIGAVIAAGGRRGMPLPLVAALAAIIGIGVGKYLLLYHFYKVSFNAWETSVFSRDVISLYPEFLRSSFEGIDILFIVLAVITAWGTANKRDQERLGRQPSMPK